MSLRRVFIVIVLLGFFVVGQFTGGISVNNSSMDGSPEALALVISTALLLFLVRRPLLPLSQYASVGKTRRFFAAQVDLIIAMIAGFAVMFPLIYVMEWLATGRWQWSWTRDTFASQDIIGVMLMFAVIGGVYQYFWLHLKSGRPTIGQFLFGYRIISLENANPRRRLHRGAIALWLWPFGLFAKEREEGVYFWDDESNTRAVSTRDV